MVACAVVIPGESVLPACDESHQPAGDPLAIRGARIAQLIEIKEVDYSSMMVCSVEYGFT